MADALEQQQKRYLLQAMAQSGSAGRQAALAAPSQSSAMQSALAEKVGLPGPGSSDAGPRPLLAATQPVRQTPAADRVSPYGNDTRAEPAARWLPAHDKPAPAPPPGPGAHPSVRPDYEAQSRAAAAADQATRSGAQDAYLTALQAALPLSKAKVDLSIAREKAKYDHDLALQERQMEQQREMGLTAAEPELQRRIAERDSLEGAARRGAEIERRLREGGMGDASTLSVDEASRLGSEYSTLQPQLARRHELDAEVGANFNPSDRGLRDRALESILGQVGGRASLGYEPNARLASSFEAPQEPSLQQQAADMRAAMYLQDPYGVNTPTTRGRDAEIAAAANLNLSDDIGSKDPSQALAQVHSQDDYARGRVAAELIGREGGSVAQLTAALEQAGIAGPARDVLIAEYLDAIGSDRLSTYQPTFDASAMP